MIDAFFLLDIYLHATMFATYPALNDYRAAPSSRLEFHDTAASSSPPGPSQKSSGAGSPTGGQGGAVVVAASSLKRTASAASAAMMSASVHRHVRLLPSLV